MTYFNDPEASEDSAGDSHELARTNGAQSGLSRERQSPAYTVDDIIRIYNRFLDDERKAKNRKLENYPRVARAYLDWCLERRYNIDEISFNLYSSTLNGSRIPTLRKFLQFIEKAGISRIAPGSPKYEKKLSKHELILYYISEKKNLRGENSKATYLTGLNTFFDYMNDNSRKFTGTTVNDFVNDAKAGKVRQSNEPYSAFTINSYLSSIRDLAKWIIENNGKHPKLNLTEENLLQLHAVLNVKGLAVEKKFYKDSLTELERDQLLLMINDAREASMIALMAFCGLRTIEVCRLEVQDIDFENFTLHVMRKGKHTKSLIKLFSNCHPYLKMYITREGLTSGKLFPGLNTSAIRTIVNRHLTITGLKREKISAHSLRHTAAQIMLDKGYTNHMVQLQLGHSEYETTLYYTRKKEEERFFNNMPNTI